MSVLMIVLIVLGVLIAITVIRSIQVIPQSSVAIVERFGRYTRTLPAGLNIRVPLLDSIRNRIDMREHVIAFPPQPVFTRDRVVVNVDNVIYYNISDPRAATYEVASYLQAMEQLTTNALRGMIGDMDLDQALESRYEINAALRGILDEATGKWGVRVNRIELKDIEPPASIQEAMEKQMRAERDKRAALLVAEGVREAALIQAKTDQEVAEIRGHRSEADRGAPAAYGSRPVDLRLALEPLQSGDPRSLGRFRLTARLGQGGMGRVYLGRSPGERLVAVKVIRQEYAADATFRRRFLREVEVVRRVGGFHTAPVVEAGVDDEQPWLATEFVPGPSLQNVIGQVGALPPTTQHVLALGVAEALEGIHACDLVHRDLKPGNIIVAGTGPRVIDFGLARALDGSRLTSTGDILGTEGFVAPEMLSGAPVTSAADLFAFGRVLCRAAGAPPVQEGDSREPGLDLLPSRLRDVVAYCLKPDPADRPTAADVLAELSPPPALSEDWLPPPVRTLVELYNIPTV